MSSESCLNPGRKRMIGKSVALVGFAALEGCLCLGFAWGGRADGLPGGEPVGRAWAGGLELATHAGANELMNGGFEQGLKGWNWGWTASLERILELGDVPPVDLVREKDGNSVLRFREETSRRPCGIQTLPLDLESNVVYTLSFRAKGDRDGVPLDAGIGPVAKKGKVDFPDGRTDGKFVLSGEWRRYSRTFRSNGGGVCVSFRGCGAASLDDVQVARGERIAYAPDPVEGRIVGTRGCRRLCLRGTDGASGTVTMSVRDFFSKTVLRKTHRFALKGGQAELPLGDAGLENGIFAVRLGYRLDDGRAWTDFARFANLVPLDGTHPTYPFFGASAWHQHDHHGEDQLKFRRDCGIGGLTWMENSFAGGKVDALRRRYGLRPFVHVLSSELPRGYFLDASPTNATPERLAYIERVAYGAGLRCSDDDTYWTLFNEEENCLPLIREKKDFETWFKFQHAGWKGLKKAFDERGLKLMYGPTHGTCMYAGPVHYEIIEGYLAAAKAHGFKYDFVSVHMYWSIDGGLFGAFEREDGLKMLFSQLRRFGYPDTTPVVIPESFNVLAVLIPQWGAVDWGDAYSFSSFSTPSYDLGPREWQHAVLQARLWLVDLVSWPRLRMSHTWQHRGAIDAEMTPLAWPLVPNVLGRLLPSPVYYGSARPSAGVRGYCFRQGGGYVMAVWATDPEVTKRTREAPAVSADLPKDARCIDLMGNPCAFSVTASPVFILSSDGDGLVRAIREAKVGCPEEAAAAVRPEEKTAAKRFRVPRVEPRKVDWDAVPAWPLDNTLGDGGGITASVKAVWSEKWLSLLVTVHGAKEPALYLALDGLGDGRQAKGEGLGPDDSAYEFTGYGIRRLRAINTQYAVGTTEAATDEEMRTEFPRRWIPSEDGGSWEIRFLPRYLVSGALKPGAACGLNLAVRPDRTAPPDSDGMGFSTAAGRLSAESPKDWPVLTLENGK